MKIGQLLFLGRSLTDENMAFLAQLGGHYLSVSPRQIGKESPKAQRPFVSNLIRDDYFRIDDLISLKKWVETHGLELFAMTVKIAAAITLGKPERDQLIENYCTSLRNMGKAGIYNANLSWNINGPGWAPFCRTSVEATGRGGSRMLKFDYDVAKQAPVTELGEVTEEAMWDSLTYFLKAVIPVAEEAHVKIGMHPADPPVPSLAGIARIIRSVKSYDRLFEVVPSEYNTMLFCLGCFSQMLEPEDVYAAIRDFGGRGKISHVHFRNARGNLEKFDEVYPDEGKLDMLKTIKILKEVGYKGPIVPDIHPLPADHMIADAEYGNIGFHIGYIKGLLQAADALD